MTALWQAASAASAPRYFAALASAAQGLPLLMVGYALLEGVGSALLIPPIYILITVLFDDTTTRARYFGVVSGAAGIGAAAGPLIGGLITSFVSWRASFILQVLIVAVIIWLGRGIADPPLPAQRPANARRLPPPGSAARPAMYALGASERGFFSLLGVIERGSMLPPDEIRDLTTAANKTSAAMAATAAEVVSMERAAHYSESSRSYLVSTINAFTAQLGAGVRQYNEMVTAAAQLVSSANGDSGAAFAGAHRRPQPNTGPARAPRHEPTGVRSEEVLCREAGHVSRR